MDSKSPGMKQIFEGILFAAGEDGVSIEALQSVFETASKEKLESVMEELKEDYDENHGIELACFAGRWKFVTRTCIFPYASRLFEQIKVPALSAAALETLAIIAYKQPITRMEIEEIRGVGCDAVLKKLAARDLITADSRSDAIGKPLLYTVTDIFMDTFALNSLQELPDLETLSPKRDYQNDLFTDEKELDQKDNPKQKDKADLNLEKNRHSENTAGRDNPSDSKIADAEEIVLHGEHEWQI